MENGPRNLTPMQQQFEEIYYVRRISQLVWGMKVTKKPRPLDENLFKQSRQTRCEAYEYIKKLH